LRKMLRCDDTNGVIESLKSAKEGYDNRPIQDPVLMLMAAITNKIDEPEDILPMSGFTYHPYQIFLFSEKLLHTSTISEIDGILTEMRNAEAFLEELVRLEIGGIKKNNNLYLMLRGAGFENLDEYLMAAGAFDLDDKDMDAHQFYVRGLLKTKRDKIDETINDFTHAIP